MSTPQYLNWVLPIACGREVLAKKIIESDEFVDTIREAHQNSSISCYIENGHIHINFDGVNRSFVEYEQPMRILASVVKSYKDIYTAEVDGSPSYHMFYNGQFLEANVQIVFDELPGEVFTP